MWLPLFQTSNRLILTGRLAYAFFLAYHTRISASVFELLLGVLPHRLFVACALWSVKALFRNRLAIFDGLLVIWACSRWLGSLPRIIRFVNPWECKCLRFTERSQAVGEAHGFGGVPWVWIWWCCWRFWRGDIWVRRGFGQCCDRKESYLLTSLVKILRPSIMSGGDVSDSILLSMASTKSSLDCIDLKFN